jgi:Spy/CpxP family protein refolding chaperone
MPGVLLLVMAMATSVAAEPAAQSPAGASSSPGAEISTPASQAPPSALESVRPQALRRRGRPNAEERRLQVMVKGLKLDAAQQAEVRRALQAQREAIRRLASAPADPEVPRVAAIRAISARTAERIRAVLNDEQKKLYGQPLPRDPSQGRDSADVEEWLNALRSTGR